MSAMSYCLAQRDCSQVGADYSSQHWMPSKRRRRHFAGAEHTTHFTMTQPSDSFRCRYNDTESLYPIVTPMMPALPLCFLLLDFSFKWPRRPPIPTLPRLSFQISPTYDLHRYLFHSTHGPRTHHTAHPPGKIRHTLLIPRCFQRESNAKDLDRIYSRSNTPRLFARRGGGKSRYRHRGRRGARRSRRPKQRRAIVRLDRNEVGIP